MTFFFNESTRQSGFQNYGLSKFQKLIDDLEEETGGYFLEMVQALFKPAHQYDTMNLHRSLSVSLVFPGAIEVLLLFFNLFYSQRCTFLRKNHTSLFMHFDDNWEE